VEAGRLHSKAVVEARDPGYIRMREASFSRYPPQRLFRQITVVLLYPMQNFKQPAGHLPDLRENFSHRPHIKAIIHSDRPMQ
jgi:hypothetical protein